LPPYFFKPFSRCSLFCAVATDSQANMKIGLLLSLVALGLDSVQVHAQNNTTPVPNGSNASNTSASTANGSYGYELKMKLAVPLLIAEFTEQVQTNFRKGIASAAEVDVQQVIIMTITAMDGSTLTSNRPSSMRRLLSPGGVRVSLKVVGLNASFARQLGVRLTGEAINQRLSPLGFAAVTITEGPTIVDASAPASAFQSLLDARFTAHSASGVGGLWRDPYGEAVAADFPVGWWRVDSVRPVQGSSLKYSPCISCRRSTAPAGTSQRNEAQWMAHRGVADRLDDGTTASRRDSARERERERESSSNRHRVCTFAQSSCAASVHATIQSIAGIPNSDAHAEDTQNSTVLPSSGEGMHKVGSAGPGAALRLTGVGGLSVPFDEMVLGYSSFTFELWLRLGRRDRDSVLRAGREQYIASCGSVVVCDNLNDNACLHATRAGPNHGWEMLILRDGRLAVRIATTRDSSDKTHQASSRRASTSGSSARGAATGVLGGGREGLAASALQMLTKSEIVSDLNDKWTLISLVVDSSSHGRGGGGRVSLYFNGTLAVSAPLWQYVMPSIQAQPELLIGQAHRRKGIPYYLAGDVDEIALFSRPLTQKQIIQHYLATTYDSNHVRPHIDCTRTTTTSSPTSTARLVKNVSS
jgi:hypothetical protein